jgi:hypothetical protein
MRAGKSGLTIFKGGKLQNHGLLYHFVVALVIIYPCWKIFQRVGLSPALSLLIFIPALGWWIVGAVLAFSRWPAFDATTIGGAGNA